MRYNKSNHRTMYSYIVNLPSAVERRKYIKEILKDESKLSLEWIEAFDARNLSSFDLMKFFDIEKFQKHYLKNPRPGEIGCTLSHQLCYKRLLNSTHKYAIIFEDDIILNANLNELIPKIEEFLDVEEPRLLLLSGWFWYKTKENFDSIRSLCKVVDGYLTHAYALNRTAARKMINPYPYFLADAWEIFRKKGVKIYGLIPHPIDQDWSGVFKSDVLTAKSEKTKLYIPSWFRLKIRGLNQRLLKSINHFEAPQNMTTRIDDIKDSLC